MGVIVALALAYFPEILSSMAHMKTVLVTCGATVPFPALMEALCTEQVLETLIKYGYERMLVQMGRGFLDRWLQLVRDCAQPAESAFPITKLGCHGEPSVTRFHDALEIVAFDYSDRIQELIAGEADLVLSHAGTGSILDAITAKKPVIVVVNNTLMDNHQLQTARAFANLNYAYCCEKPTKEQLLQSLSDAHLHKLRSYPNSYNEQFEQLLLSTATN